MAKKTMEDVANMDLEKGASHRKPKTPVRKKSSADAKHGKKAKKREKPVKGSFSLAPPDYALLAELKERCKKEGVPYRKNDLIAAGLRSLSAMSATVLLRALTKRPTSTGKAGTGKAAATRRTSGAKS